MKGKCSNPNCKKACGPNGETMFGSGPLNPYGYWQIPCRTCAKEFELSKEQIKAGIREELLSKGYFPLDVAQHIVGQTWLNLPAWPHAA